MISVDIRLNNSTLIANVQCIRVQPLAKPEDGEECSYRARVYNIDVGVINHPYGDAEGLAKKMIEFYFTLDEDRIADCKMRHMMKVMQEMK